MDSNTKLMSLLSLDSYNRRCNPGTPNGNKQN